jgi:hypothetical protein
MGTLSRKHGVKANRLYQLAALLVMVGVELCAIWVVRRTGLNGVVAWLVYLAPLVAIFVARAIFD